MSAAAVEVLNKLQFGKAIMYTGPFPSPRTPVYTGNRFRDSHTVDYSDSVRWQHLLAPLICLVDLCSADVATSAALPQNRVKAQVKYKIETEIRAYLLYKTILYYEKYSTLNLHSHKIYINTKLQLFMKQELWYD